MDVQSEARSLLSAWLRHEEEAADLKSLARAEPGRHSFEVPKIDVAKEDAKWNAYKTVENRLRDVRIETEGGPLAEDVDVALKLLTQRRREACEAKALARARDKPRMTRAPPAELDPALRMEVRHQAQKERRRAPCPAEQRPQPRARAPGSSSHRCSKAKSRVAPARSVSGEDLQDLHQCLVSESDRLEEETQRTRQDVEREAQAIRELRRAEGERNRKAKVLEQLTQQLQHVQKEKASASQQQQREAISVMVMVSEALWKRWRWTCCHGSLRHWQEITRTLHRKGRRITCVRNISTMSTCVQLWRELVISSTAEREAAKHLEELQRCHQRATSAVAHCQHRLLRRGWTGWLLYLRWVEGEKATATVAAKATAFLASLPTPDVESTSPAAELDTVLEPDRVAEVVEPDTEPLEISQVEAPKARRSKSCPKILREIEKRSEQRRKSQEERNKQRQVRLQQEKQVQEQGRVTPRRGGVSMSSDGLPQARQHELEVAQEIQQTSTEEQGDNNHGTGHVEVAGAQVQRPKALVEMEKRALARREAHELRRQRMQQKEDEKRQRLAEEEQRQREAEEEAKRERIQAQKQKHREEQRMKAQKLVAQALRRDKERSARELYILHRYIRVWCALRQEVSQSHFLNLMAFNRRGHRLLRYCCLAWQRCWLHHHAATWAARLGRAHLALSWFARRHAFRCIVAVLRAFLCHQKRLHHDSLTLASTWQIRRAFSLWTMATQESIRQKRCAALQMYAQHLLRKSLHGWRSALQELRLEDALEIHKRALREKVSGWLQEMEEFGDRKENCKRQCTDYFNLPAAHLASAKRSNMRCKKGL